MAMIYIEIVLRNSLTNGTASILFDKHFFVIIFRNAVTMNTHAVSDWIARIVVAHVFVVSLSIVLSPIGLFLRTTIAAFIASPVRHVFFFIKSLEFFCLVTGIAYFCFHMGTIIKNPYFRKGSFYSQIQLNG